MVLLLSLLTVEETAKVSCHDTTLTHIIRIHPVRDVDPRVLEEDIAGWQIHLSMGNCQFSNTYIKSSVHTPYANVEVQHKAPLAFRRYVAITIALSSSDTAEWWYARS